MGNHITDIRPITPPMPLINIVYDAILSNTPLVVEKENGVLYLRFTDIEIEEMLLRNNTRKIQVRVAGLRWNYTTPTQVLEFVIAMLN
jgi:hypothetical protein